MIRKLHQKIFEFMKYKQFMKPFVIGMHIMLLLVALSNVIMIGNEYSLAFYLISLVWITIVGHLGLKLWEVIFVFLLKLKGGKKENIK